MMVDVLHSIPMAMVRYIMATQATSTNSMGALEGAPMESDKLVQVMEELSQARLPSLRLLE